MSADDTKEEETAISTSPKQLDFSKLGFPHRSQVRLELYLRKYWYFSHQKMMDFRFAYKVQRFSTRRFYARNKLRGAAQPDISMSTGPI